MSKQTCPMCQEYGKTKDRRGVVSRCELCSGFGQIGEQQLALYRVVLSLRNEKTPDSNNDRGMYSDIPF
jgi:hypothetical protein